MKTTDGESSAMQCSIPLRRKKAAGIQASGCFGPLKQTAWLVDRDSIRFDSLLWAVRPLVMPSVDRLDIHWAACWSQTSRKETAETEKDTEPSSSSTRGTPRKGGEKEI